MHVIYAQQPLPKAIFLAGPTPRDKTIPSWRTSAIELLRNTLQFTGSVYVPESLDKEIDFNKTAQIRWEWEALNIATVIVFWIPRDLETLPGFTTNVEFGLTSTSSKCVLGFPPHTPKVAYLAELASRYQIPVFHDLETALAAAVEKTKSPFAHASE